MSDFDIAVQIVEIFGSAAVIVWIVSLLISNSVHKSNSKEYSRLYHLCVDKYAACINKLHELGYEMKYRDQYEVVKKKK